MESIVNTTVDTKALWPAFLGQAPKQLFIDGAWSEAASGETFETVNPSNGQNIAYIASGGARDVERAVSAARKAFEGVWSRFTPFERQAAILRLAELVDREFDDLSLLDCLEMGAPLSRLRGPGRKRALGRLRFYAGMATTINGHTIENSASREMLTYTLREPIGVIGAIIPWNAPLTSALWKIGPALATGCTVVLKPAEQASLSCLRLAELCMEAGIPAGVVNVVTGFGENAGAALTQHLDVDKIAFTGSHLVGQKIIQASIGNLKRVTLELGGKSPDIVFADADLNKAVPGAAMGVFGNTGQVCCAGTRLFVQRPIYDEFIERVATFASALVVGDGLDPKSDIGPVVSHEQMDRVLSYIKIGLDEGATMISGGARLTDGALASGYFLPPTIFGNIRDDMRVAQEEIFGPVVCAIPFDTVEEVERRANATPFGLGSGVWTQDISKAHRLSKTIKAGSVWINCYNVMDPAVPFGGYKLSGYGREGGVEHVDEYLNTKSVWVNHA